jgi:hypothetical protein
MDYMNTTYTHTHTHTQIVCYMEIQIHRQEKKFLEIELVKIPIFQTRFVIV